MTESEWEQCHPQQAEAYIDAWTDKRKREEYAKAELNMNILQPWSKKPLKLKDFIPKWAMPDSQDLLMAEVARELAKQKQNNG